MVRWAELEAEKGELGNLAGEPQFSARWIFQQAWGERDKLCSAGSMVRWAEFEAEKGELGNLTGEPQFSARWIFQQALRERDKFCSAELMLRWAHLETERGELGGKDEPEKYSARWILRKALKMYPAKNINFFNVWISVEIQAKMLVIRLTVQRHIPRDGLY
jgi:hypothetical protein